MGLERVEAGAKGVALREGARGPLGGPPIAEGAEETATPGLRAPDRDPGEALLGIQVQECGRLQVAAGGRREINGPEGLVTQTLGEGGWRGPGAHRRGPGAGVRGRAPARAAAPRPRRGGGPGEP